MIKYTLKQKITPRQKPRIWNLVSFKQNVLRTFYF